MGTLTIEEGIKIQTEDLAKWKQLLKLEVYEWLEKRTVKNNHLAKNGYDINRGGSLSTDVQNYFYHQSRKE